MKIAVIGAGGVGGYFGGRLAAAGHQVFFAVRGRQREAFREQGLRLKSALGDLTLPDPLLLDNPETIGVCDAVLICTKLWGLEEALELVRPLVGDDTMVVPLQNGVDAESLAVERLGAGAVLGGVAYIAAEIEEPGVIRHTGKMARLALGELDGRESPRLKALVAACQAAQVDVKLSTHIQKDIWTKFVILTALSGATAYHRAPIGEVLSNPAGRDFHRALVFETAAVARASAIPLAEDCESRTIAQTEALPPQMKSSMLVDLERGNPLELHWLSGSVVRLGTLAGVDTPQHREVVSNLDFASEGHGNLY